MDPDRISALLSPFLDRPLARPQLDQISTYIDLLLRWNARINLTAVRDPESIVTRHFGESLFLARHIFPALPEDASQDLESHPEDCKLPEITGSRDISAAKRRKRAAHGVSRGLAGREAEQAPLRAKAETPSVPRPSRSVPGSGTAGSFSVLDIGSGAGFPALPLKIWAPHISLTLIESNHKKAAFLREAGRTLALTDINVIAERAEILLHRVPPAFLVTLRAVERFEKIVPLAARFLAPTGRLSLLIGAAQFPSLISLTPQLSWPPPIPIPHSESRVIAISHPST